MINKNYDNSKNLSLLGNIYKKYIRNRLNRLCVLPKQFTFDT